MSKPIGGEMVIEAHPQGHKFPYVFDPDVVKLQEVQDTRDFTAYKGVVLDESLGFGMKKDAPGARLIGMPIEVRVYTANMFNNIFSWYKSLIGSEHVNLPIALILVNKSAGFVFRASQLLPVLDNPPASLVGCMNISLAVIEGVLKIHSLGRPTNSSGGVKIENILVTNDNKIVVDTPSPCLPNVLPREVSELMKKDILGVGFILNCIWKLNPNCISQNDPTPKPKKGGKPATFKIPQIVEKVLKAVDSISYSVASTPKTPSLSPTQTVDLTGISSDEITLKDIHKIFMMEMDNIIYNISSIQPAPAQLTNPAEKKDIKKSKREESAANSAYEQAMSSFVGNAYSSPWCSIIVGSNLGAAGGQDRGAGLQGAGDEELAGQLNGITDTVTSLSTKLKLLITNNNRLTTALMQQKERLKSLEANTAAGDTGTQRVAKQQQRRTRSSTNSSNDVEVTSNQHTQQSDNVPTQQMNLPPSTPSAANQCSGLAMPPLPADFLDTLETLKKEINALSQGHDDGGNIRFVNVDNKTVLREYVFLPPHEINKKVPRVVPWGNLSKSAVSALDSNDKIVGVPAAGVNVPPSIVDSFVVNGVGFANIEKLTGVKLDKSEAIVTTCSYHDVTTSRSYILCLTQVTTPIQSPTSSADAAAEPQFSISYNLHLYGVTDSTYYVISNETSGDKGNLLITTISSMVKVSSTRPKTMQAFMCCIYLSSSESSGNDDLLCIGLNGANKMVVCDMAGIIHCISNGADSTLDVNTIRIPKIETDGDHSVAYPAPHEQQGGEAKQLSTTLIFRTIQKAKGESDDKKSPKSSLSLISFPSKAVELVRAQCEVIVPTVCTTGRPVGVGDALLSIQESGAERPTLSALLLSAGSFETLERPVLGDTVLVLSEPNNKSAARSTEWAWLDWRKKDEVVLNRSGTKATRLPICPMKNSVVAVCACGACCGRNVPCTCGGGHMACYDQHRSSWVTLSAWME